MKNLIYFILFLGIDGWLLGQDIVLSYELKPVADDQYTLQVYMQSMSDQDVALGAINFSLALPAGCVQVMDQKSIFDDSWTSYLESVKSVPNLDLTYGNWHYSQRWQYGNADPGLPTTTEVVAPARQKEALKIMEISLKGSCADQLYLEQQAENGLNQMADAALKPITWTVAHPETELAIEGGLMMKVYPNPVGDLLNIHFEGERETALELELFSVEGKSMMRRRVDKYAGEEFTFNLADLPTGVYMLAVSAFDADFHQLKIIKK